MSCIRLKVFDKWTGRGGQGRRLVIGGNGF
jgi:hypothetical protein